MIKRALFALLNISPPKKMNKTKLQEALIHGALMDMEIDAEDCRAEGGQVFFLLSKRDAGKVIARCFALHGWSPSLVPFDLRLPPAGKGRQWIATDHVPPVSPSLALATLYGMRAVNDREEGEAIIAWAEANPDQLTTGQAFRGLESLRAMVERWDA